MILFLKRIRTILDTFSLRERFVFWSALGVAMIGGVVLIGFVWGNATKIVPARGGSFTEGIVGQFSKPKGSGCGGRGLEESTAGDVVFVGHDRARGGYKGRTKSSFSVKPVR